MSDAIEHGKVILAGILSTQRRDRLDQAQRQLEPEHFVEPTHQTMFSLLVRYAESTGAILTRPAISDIMRSQADAAKALLYEELYDALAATFVPDDSYLWSMEQIRELEAERRTLTALTEAAEVLRTGMRNKRGELIKGHVQARALVQASFGEIERGLNMQDAPEGDMRNEQAEMLQDYADRVAKRMSGASRGVMTGIPAVDEVIGGAQPGELVLPAGFSSDGKSTFCAQWAWSAAIEQGLNVVILTTETTRDQFRRKIIARHSVMPQFGLPDGINTRDLRNGTVPDTHLHALREVVHDLTTHSQYGRLYVAQVPRGASISTCEAQLYRIQRMLKIDMAIFDYFALLRADERRDSDRESLGGILKAGKQLATTFDHGRGIVVASPWQMNRKAKEYADINGLYLPEHLAETAEATNSPDIIFSILSNVDKDQRIRDVLMQVLKNRDGATVTTAPLRVRVDYGTCAFGRAQAAQVSSGMASLTGGSDVDMLGSLLPS